MKKALLILLALFVSAEMLSGRENTETDVSLDLLEKQFRELPMTCRRLTGPLFWLHGDESKERLEDMFQLMKYTDMGGIDAVFNQFIAGRRDPGLWQTPKLGSSISHAYGKANDLAMVEIFGARGQDLSYPEMKWWTDHMHVSGINFHIQHSFNPKAPFDRDCPPYFYNGGYEPRWPLYRVYADYTSRLSLMLSGGHHVCPVAFLFLGNSRHVGESITPEQLSTVLQDALFDCDWMPYEVFENDTTINDKQLCLYKERYRILIVPAVQVIPFDTLAKVKHFYDDGGVVVGYGMLPEKSATLGKTTGDIAGLREAIWGHQPQMGTAVCNTSSAGGRSYFLPKEPTVEHVQQVLTADAGIHPTLEVIQGATNNWLHVLHRVKKGRDVFFICNQDIEGSIRPFTFHIQANGFPECWDSMRNEITAVPFVRKNDIVEVKMSLAPNESTLLVFQEHQRKRPQRIEPGMTAPLKTLALIKDDATYDTIDLPKIEDPYRKNMQDCRWIWYPDTDPKNAAPVGTVYFRKVFETNILI